MIWQQTDKRSVNTGDNINYFLRQLNPSVFHNIVINILPPGDEALSCRPVVFITHQGSALYGLPST